MKQASKKARSDRWWTFANEKVPVGLPYEHNMAFDHANQFELKYRHIPVESIKKPRCLPFEAS